jgi:hypothetical protein
MVRKRCINASSYCHFFTLSDTASGLHLYHRNYLSLLTQPCYQICDLMFQTLRKGCDSFWKWAEDHIHKVTTFGWSRRVNEVEGYHATQLFLWKSIHTVILDTFWATRDLARSVRQIFPLLSVVNFDCQPTDRNSITNGNSRIQWLWKVGCLLRSF